jgi:hypothetical protein
MAAFKRRVWWSIIGVTLLACAAGGAFFFWERKQRPSGDVKHAEPAPTLSGDKPKPSRETFERVRIGMTRAEVEAVVGGPHGYYAPGELDCDLHRCWQHLGVRSTYDGWVSRDGELLVLFEAGVAQDVKVLDVVYSPLDRAAVRRGTR